MTRLIPLINVRPGRDTTHLLPCIFIMLVDNGSKWQFAMAYLVTMSDPLQFPRSWLPINAVALSFLACIPQRMLGEFNSRNSLNINSSTKFKTILITFKMGHWCKVQKSWKHNGYDNLSMMHYRPAGRSKTSFVFILNWLWMFRLS